MLIKSTTNVKESTKTQIEAPTLPPIKAPMATPISNVEENTPLVLAICLSRPQEVNIVLQINAKPKQVEVKAPNNITIPRFSKSESNIFE